MKIGFISLGCCKNLVDTEYIIGLFKDGQFEIEADPKKCDVIIINTCGFIESAKTEAINTILEMAELKNDRLKKLIVCGCLSQRYRDELIKEIPEVDLFIKIDEYDKLDLILNEVLETNLNKVYMEDRLLTTPKHYAYLKIAEGCDNRCAYCAIPLIRGNCRSFSIEDNVKEAKRLYDLGVRELNVIAQDTTYYGYDLYHKFALADLLKELDKIPFEWIRVLYMYPDEISDDLLYTMKDLKRVVPYFDIPVQYGNDEILKKMNRRGSVKLIKERIEMIRKLFDDAFIRTTMIVGFPYETEKTFEDTLAFVNDIKFDALGAFTYSDEEDTKAYEYDQKLDEDIKEERYDRLMLLQKDLIEDINQKHLNKTYRVVIERYEELFDRYAARAFFNAPDDIDGYIYVKSKEELKVGSFYDVRITKVDGYDLYAIKED